MGVDKLLTLERRVEIPSPLPRALSAQFLGGLFRASLFLVHTAAAPSHIWIALLYAVLSIAVLVVALASQRLTKETNPNFIAANSVTLFVAIFSLAVLGTREMAGEGSVVGFLHEVELLNW